MRDEPVELLSDIGLAGNEDGLLMQPIGIEAARGVEQHCHLVGNPRLDRLRSAAGRGFRLCGQRSDFLRALYQHSSQSFAFMPAHRGQFREGRMEAPDDRCLGGASLRLALILVDHVDHPFKGEDSVEPRRGGVHAPSQSLDGRQHGREHRFVDTHDRSDA